MDETQHIFAIIVGGGMSGITLGAQLLRRKALPLSEFMIVDRNADFGGVWEANKYPGAACDVPSHAYQVRFNLKPDWSRKYGGQQEIQGYYAEMGRRYNLHKVTRFNTTVASATWNEDTLLWEVILKENGTGKQSRMTANVVVNAGGQFSRPKYANIPGRENFKGEQWHTSQWQADVDLTGKRVAMIGTGPSTAQVAPKIQPQVGKLTILQRSATYVVPRGDDPHPWWRKMLFKWVPGALHLYHLWYYFTIESSKRMWMSGTPEQAMSSAYALQHLKDQVHDPVVRQKLTPTHQFGCKRILILDDWYPMFNQPNVELVTDKPIRITEKGVVTHSVTTLPPKSFEGEPATAYNAYNEDPEAPTETEHEIDILLWGTGFDMSDQGGHFDVYGIDGVKLSDHWGQSPRAYYAVGVNKFPNFFLVLGPNSANFWSNLTTLVEVQTRYNADLIKYIRNKCRTQAFAMNVKADVQQQYNDHMFSTIGDVAVVSPGCQNYYTNDSGELSYWNPLHGWTYAWRLLWPVFKHYDFYQKQGDGGKSNGHINAASLKYD